MARTRVVGDKVLRVASGLGRRVPGVVTKATGVDSAGAASATGCTINVFDQRSPLDKARPGSVKNTDGTTLETWDFAADSGLKFGTAATVAAATSGTVDASCGKFIIASGSATYTLSNSYISGATSLVFRTNETSGDTVTVLSVVPTAGQAVFTMSAAVGADTTISFLVVN